MLQTEFENKVREIKMLEAQAKQLTDKAKEIRTKIGELPDLANPGDRRSAGQFLVAIERNAQFNVDKAKEILTDEQYYEICDLVPSRKLAEDNLPPVLYKRCQREGAPKLVIKNNPDYTE